MWGDAWDRLFEDNDHKRMVVRIGNAAMLAAALAAADAIASTARIARDMKHPRYRDNVTPSSPKPRIRKGR